MAQLLVMILAVLLSQGYSQRVLPKGYEFKCQPKDGQGILGIAEDLSKLNEGDYAKMMKFDSLRKVAELMNESLPDLDKIQKSDAYKKLLDIACSLVHVDIEFYMKNFIAFYQFLLEEFKKHPTPSISEDMNKINFLNMTNTVLNQDRHEKFANIKNDHIRNEKTVNESMDAIESFTFNMPWQEVTSMSQVRKLHRIIEAHNIPADAFFNFTVYYATTFWQRSSAPVLSLPYTLHGVSAIFILTSFKLFKFKLF